MRQAGRIFETIQILHRMTQSPVPMDRVCGDYFRNRRAIGSKDRADIAERVYRIMRHHARISWWADQCGIDASPRIRVLIALVLLEGVEDPAELFTGDKHTPDMLSDEEAKILPILLSGSIEPDNMPILTRLECPPAYAERLQARYGDNFEAELRAMQQAAGLTIRVNTVKTTRDDLAKTLKADGVETTPTRYSADGLHIQGKVFLGNHKSYQKGLFEIQDEGSQLIAALCAAQPKMQVLDFCAGSGGKTLALAAAMRNAGRIVAMDIEGRRLEKSRPRLRRSDIHNVELRSLQDEKNRKWLRRQKAAMDVVLVDAPCSGAGTWRRHPDTRWHVYGPSLQELLVTQADILDRVAPLVKHGGRLVYATCSILQDENEDQISAFLHRHPDYKILPLAQAISGVSDIPQCDGDMMSLSPHRQGTDGFFACALLRE